MNVTRKFLGALLVSGLTILAETAGQSNEALVSAIMRGDRAAVVKMLAASGADVNAKDAEGNPLLMDAVLFGDLEMVRTMLDKGADPNATNPLGATALLWAAGDPAKANLLLDRGANPNAASKLGRTPLLAAAPLAGNGALVERLIKMGADTKAVDVLEGIPVILTGGGKAPAIVEAAKARDGVALRHLLAKGADVNAKDHNGGTALTEALAMENVENVKALLAAGADVEAKVSMVQYRPLMIAAVRRNAQFVRMLIKAGADVNARDAFGSTPLMWASYGAENSDAAAVKLLLDAGADAAVVNKRGESAMTWASWHGETAAAKLIGAKAGRAGARVNDAAMVRVTDAVSKPVDQTELRLAIAAAIPALQKTGPVSVKNSGCVSCHSQSFPSMALNMAKTRGFELDEKVLDAQRRAVIGVLKPAVELALEGSDVIPQLPVSGGMLLMGLASYQHPADRLTAAIVQAVANRQMADGSWPGWSLRPPMSGGDLRETAFGARALSLYAPAGRQAEMKSRLAGARTWLLKAKPESPEEEIVRLMGLTWTGASREEIRKAGARVLALQQRDGGWRQLETRTSDAYATGEALVALVDAGVIRASDAAYQRGVRYLLDTRKADGTWQVVTRAYPFQPLNDSGFPHGRDQWISAAASSWSTMALLYALDDAAPVRVAER